MFRKEPENSWDGAAANRSKGSVTAVIALCVALGSGAARADIIPAGTEVPGASLTHLSIEDLMNLEVKSVSKKAERFSDTAAAITVVDSDQIHRSGALRIPDLLRTVPGMDVAQVDGRQWAISSRGFNDLFANKLLVLIDGRSVYTPLFSGVWWDVQDPVMEDLERVEVIRGPGATLWGANAVNGVISIVSKSSKDTQGLLLSGGGGNVERGFGTVRYGGRLSDSLTYRVFAKAGTRDDAPTTDGSKPFNGYKLAHGGTRFDWEISKETLLTAQGDFYEGRMRETYVNSIPKMPPATLLTRGGNALSRLTHDFSEASQLQIQTYYDETLRNGGGTYERRRTFDFDFQQRIRMVEWNEVVFGGGYRLMDDDLTGGTYPKLVPPTSTTRLLSAFLQDELTLVPEKLTLTLGTKVEHNDYTGIEVQPSARLLWRITPTQSAWASVSRATRTPSRAERDLRIDTPTPAGTIARLSGNPNLLAGDMWAYEIGHRINLGSKVLFDTAVFFNHYTRLRTSDPSGAPIPGAPPIIPVRTQNNLAADSYGIELGPRVNLSDWWRVRLAYSYLEIDAQPSPFAKGLDAGQIEGRSPQNMFSAVSSWDLPGNIDLDATVRYTSALANIKVPAYVEMDLRLAWRANQHVEFALVGQSLLNGQHAEFAPSVLNTQRTAVERSIYGSVTIKF